MTVSGGDAAEVFEIGIGRHGDDLGPDHHRRLDQQNGGGLFNLGTLTLTGCTVSGNSAGDEGGGLFNDGMLTLTDCTVSGNSAGPTAAGSSTTTTAR